MSKVLKISEAASLALHTMLLLTEHQDKLVSTRDIAETLKVSEAHLSKVLQRLSKAGLVVSLRGPRGGFKLLRPSADVSLLEIYECIEGPLVESRCLFDNPVCSGNHCILGDILVSVNMQIRDYLASTRLDAFKSGDAHFEFLSTKN